MPAGWPVWSPRQSQDTLCVHVAVQRIHGDLAATAAGANDGHLAVERDPFLVDEAEGAHVLPGAPSIFQGPDHYLALAVVTEPPCFENPGKADFAHRPLELGARAHRLPT